MPQRGVVGAPRFSGDPDNLLGYLEDVRGCCMQSGCFEDQVWARWSIWYLRIERFPRTQYSKYDLYDLVDEQKKVKIDSFEALLDYWLCFTKVVTCLQVTSQLSSIKKDNLYLKGHHADDPWPTCQVTREAERLLEKGYCLELREARIVRDQWKAQEAQYEARMQELRAMRAQERCCERERPGSRASKFPSPTLLETYPLTKNLQDSFMPSKVTPNMGNELLMVELQGNCLQKKPEVQNEEDLLGTKPSVEPEVTETMGDSPIPQSKYFHSPSSPSTDFPSQDLSIKPQDAKDEPHISMLTKYGHKMSGFEFDRTPWYAIFQTSIQCLMYEHNPELLIIPCGSGILPVQALTSVNKSAKGGKAKMCLGPAKNGRLTSAQRMAYDNEAAVLATSNTWDAKSICNGVLH
ncbi:hypothetical protein BKA83DRAFT_4125593 [Pisolithus microcarpus]|nr:hypothetical protein BKA83DRAFT_4125593 [Pisolithus microcarpus]